MAISYDDWKKQYEGMTTEQQKNYANMVKGNATATEYANRYIQEKQNAGSFGTQTANSYTNTNQSTNTSTSTNNYQNSYSNNGTNGGNTQQPDYFSDQYITDNSEEAKAARARGLQNMQDQQNQQFDSSKLTNPNAQITVKAGNAAQTGLPDYQDTSDAREQEIINNLNAYWNTNKSFFSDRATFNSTFHYNERNDRQKAILDSFWKGTENYNKATSYTDGKSFSTALNSGNVTEAQYAGMKDWNPEVFKEWQDQLKEEMNLAISNLSKITTNYDNAEILQTMMEKLGIEPQQGRDIIGGWEEMMDRTGAWSTMKDATKARESYNAVADKMTSIMNRYSSSTGGNQSDALVAARLQKALAPYQQQAQNYYSAWQMANTEFQTKLGTSNNYASTIQAQAAEDQRIFQQKLTSLGFAMQVNSYRTPEQQAALQLQTQQIQNNMALYQQSRLNELSLYNQKQLNDLNLQYQEDLTKLQNKLSYELKDLSVEDPEQLRANLNNILTDYFSKYGDIIQRSQSQVVEDVIAYAKEKGISVAQALKENFITPLQNKQEYKNMIATNYAAPVTQSVSINNDGSVSVNATTPGGVSYNPVSSFNMNTGLLDFENNHSSGSNGGWCGKFVNDYLQSIGVGRLYGDSLSNKLNTINTDKTDLSNLSVGSIAVFDYSRSQGVGENAKNYGHVAIVTEIDQSTGMVKLMESNYNGDKKVTTNRWVDVNKAPSLQGFFDPSKGSNQVDESNVYQQVSDNDIYNYNDATLNRKLTAEQRQAIMEARNDVYSNPNSSMEDILRFSQGGKTPTDTTVQSLDKYAQALTSLGTITELLEGVDTGPVIGALRSNNPYDVKARQIQTAIAGLLPTLARGVYGEVGVLTDKDIEHYSKTVPNLRSTSDVNQAILAMTLDMLADGYKRKLSTQASLGYDVSGMAGIYQQITSKANELMSGIGSGKSGVGGQSNYYDWYGGLTTTQANTGAGSIVTFGGTAYSSNFYEN